MFIETLRVCKQPMRTIFASFQCRIPADPVRNNSRLAAHGKTIRLALLDLNLSKTLSLNNSAPPLAPPSTFSRVHAKSNLVPIHLSHLCIVPKPVPSILLLAAAVAIILPNHTFQHVYKFILPKRNRFMPM